MSYVKQERSLLWGIGSRWSAYLQVHGTLTSAQLARALQQLTPTSAQLARALRQLTPTSAQLARLSALRQLTPTSAQLARLGCSPQTETPISEIKRGIEVLQTSLGGMDEEEDEEEDYEDVAPKFGFEKWTSIGRS